MEITKLDLKLFAGPATNVAPEELIPVFHRFIRDRVLPETLIDVADYAHVPDGPGVLLICHEHHYAFDFTDGEPGLLVSRRRGPRRDLASLFRTALDVARQLEQQRELAGRLTFPGDRFTLTINDRLVRARPGRPAPLSFEIHELLARIAPHSPAVVERADQDGRIGFEARLPAAPGVSALLSRLDAPRLEESSIPVSATG